MQDQPSQQAQSNDIYYNFDNLAQDFDNIDNGSFQQEETNKPVQRATIEPLQTAPINNTNQG